MRIHLAFGILLPVVAAVLVGCGGGGGANTALNTIRGVAATGAPIANAPVFLKDANGAEPTGQNQAIGVALVTTDDNGAYSFPSSALEGLRAPFILRVAGTKVLDSGDDASAILHAVVPTAAGGTANLTPLTEAATILTLGTDTNSAFQTPQNSVANYTSAAAQSANAALLRALPVPIALANLDVVSGALDAQPTVNLSSAAAAKLHDMLLDTFEFSTSQGQLVLSDRNRAEDQLVGGPQIVISAPSSSSSSIITPTGGAMEGINTDGLLDPTKLQAFLNRFNTQLNAGCLVPLQGAYQNTCDNVVSSSHGVFSSAYKHTGMTADKWLSSWVATPLDVENLGDVTVSLRAAYRGTFMATSTQRVTRVALKFARQNGDFIIRTMLLADDGQKITVFGNQKDYFLWARPRLSVNPDTDDTYPYNPKYQVGVQFILKHWYAGMPNMILGAHIDGPGLPSSRFANGSAPSGEVSNPNNLQRGIEIFSRTDVAAACSNMAIDPSVYVEKNTRSWDAAWTDYKTHQFDRSRLYDGSIRWRQGITTCDPTFDMRRYHGATATPYLPKRGDSYTVTLYLDATKWGGSGQPQLPAGAGSRVTGKINADGDSLSYYPLVVTETLRADAFALPTSVPATQLPGVTDATRSRLLNYAQGTDRVIDWTRNLVAWPDIDANNNIVNTAFGNFLAGVFMSSGDQMYPADSGYVSFSPYPTAWGTSIPQGFKDYREFFTTSVDPGMHLTITNGTASGRLDLDCGKSTTYKGSTVRVRVRKVTNLRTGNSNDRMYEEVSCSAAQTALSTGTWTPYFTGNNAFYRDTNSGNTETVRYQYDVVRDRIRFQSDKNTLVTGNQLSRTMTWAQMMGKEKAGSQAMCSSFEGAYPYRSAYVIMIDTNGRQIKETREVWGDLPGMSDVSNNNLYMATRYTNESDLLNGVSGANFYGPPITRAIDISRPYYLTDSIYLPMSFDVSEYALDWTVPVSGTSTSDYSWMPNGNNKWHGQPGLIQPAYEKANANATTCTRVAYN